mmetsp:Transcript_79163/g.220058  ORF Transcript_79163/g.220058 Transcript_79163/m.220058 type:complete len:225 (-) Transcript_79163:182-856(-)
MRDSMLRPQAKHVVSASEAREWVLNSASRLEDGSLPTNPSCCATAPQTGGPLAAFSHPKGWSKSGPGYLLGASTSTTEGGKLQLTVRERCLRVSHRSMRNMVRALDESPACQREWKCSPCSPGKLRAMGLGLDASCARMDVRCVAHSAEMSDLCSSSSWPQGSACQAETRPRSAWAGWAASACDSEQGLGGSGLGVSRAALAAMGKLLRVRIWFSCSFRSRQRT